MYGISIVCWKRSSAELRTRPDFQVSMAVKSELLVPDVFPEQPDANHDDNNIVDG